MRFIGSKAALLEEIEAVIQQNVQGKKQTFCDLFSGTGTVARHFKSAYTVYSNDLLHFSYVIQKATVENNCQPLFQGLKSCGIDDPFPYLESTPIVPGKPPYRWFLLRNYAPYEGCPRRYLTCENAARIDFIRETVEQWFAQKRLTEHEYYYLLACLLEGIPYVSNITGTYGAFLKGWDPRVFTPFRMARLTVTDNHRTNHSFHRDALELLQELCGDILYIDPPYNSRQYAANYHLLETVSRGDAPPLRGITGVRPYKAERSRFCSRKHVRAAFEELLERARFTDLVVSYSTDGLMAGEEIEAALKRHGDPASFRRYDIPYRKYQSKAPPRAGGLREYLFYIRKA